MINQNTFKVFASEYKSAIDNSILNLQPDTLIGKEFGKKIIQFGVIVRMKLQTGLAG